MGKAKHLNLEERNKITILYAEGKKRQEIAEIIDRSPSVISNELNRLEAVYYRGKYIGSQTRINVEKKWQNSHRCKRIDDLDIQEYIVERLTTKQWSPQLLVAVTSWIEQLTI